MALWGRLALARRDFAEYRQAAARRRAAEAALRGQIAARLEALAGRPLPASDGQRTLVMGLSANYGPAELAPFVRSLRGSGYRGEAALFLSNAPEGTRAFLASQDVGALPFDMLPLLPMSMNSARMFRYLDHLTGALLRPDGGSDYRWVMLADIRDVVFQGDPVTGNEQAEILFHLEREGRTIGGCPVNARWMRQALGEAALRRAAAAPVSCAGTLVATPRALLSYLLQMCRLILEAPAGTRHSGIDQAIHNHILVEGLVAGARAVPNGGAVMTVPDDAPHGLRPEADGVLRNADGSVSAVVHQYDRDPALREAVLRRWGLGSTP